MTEDTNDKQVQNLTNRDANIVNDSLTRRLGEVLKDSSKVVEIPAGKDNESVNILRKPVYIPIDHGGTMISYNQGDPEERREASSMYATYLFQTNSGETRFMYLPVALLPGEESYNGALAQEIREQGISSDSINAACRYEETYDKFPRRVDSLPVVRDLIQDGVFLEDAPHPENPAPRFHLQSGWHLGDLTMIGRNGNFFRSDVAEVYSSGGGKVMSDPISEHPQGIEQELLERVLAANE